MIKTIKLQSGITLILEHMDEVRSVCIGIWCNTGSSNELPQEEGISHFIEHMVFKGTKNRSSFQIVDEIDSIGGEINAFTGKESTCFYIKCLDEHFFKSCDVLTDLIENPLFLQEDIDKEKLVVIEEINMSTDDPDDVSLDRLETLVFAGSRLSHAVLGSKETVNSFNSDALRQYYNEHYTKESLIVSIAGSFDEGAAIEYFDKHFASMPSKSRFDDKGVASNVIKYETIEKDIEQAHITLGVTTVSATDENRYRLSMLSTLLGGGMSSRLFQNVREKKGLAYSVYSMNGFYNAGGAFVIYAGVAKDRVEEALDAIHEELDILSNNRIEDREYLSAKEQLKSSYIFSQENVKSRMTSNGRNYLALGKCPTQAEILAMLDEISIDDIESAKHLICDYSKYSIVNVTG